MSSLYDYLKPGLLQPVEQPLEHSKAAVRVLRPELMSHVRAVARDWAQQGVDASVVEMLSEWMARIAAQFDDDAPEKESPKPSLASRSGQDSAPQDGSDDVLIIADLSDGTDWLGLPDSVLEFLTRAVGQGLDGVGLAALAVHVLDIAEALAVEVFVPELAGLTAKADRSGDAARMVGLGRHLRG